MDDVLILETKYWKVILHEKQVYLGYSIIILKREAKALRELSEEEVLDLHSIVVPKMEKALKKAFGATMFNWSCLMNFAYREKPYNPHVHWHLFPRYDKKVKIENKTYGDPNFSHHYKTEFMKKSKSLNIDELEVIADKIRENLD